MILEPATPEPVRPEVPPEAVVHADRFAWIAWSGAAYVVGLLLFGAWGTLRFWDRLAEPGWTWQHRGGETTMVWVDPEGPAAALLRPGDRLLAVRGDPRLSRYTLRVLVPARGEYTVRFARRGEPPREARLRIGEGELSGVGAQRLAYLAVALAFVLVGTLVGVARPGEPSARIFCLATQTAALFFLWSLYKELRPFLGAGGEPLLLAAGVAHPLELVLAYHFYYRFPPSVARGRLWDALLVALWVVGTGLVLSQDGLAVLRVLGPEVAVPVFSRAAGPLMFRIHLFSTYLVVCCLAVCAVIARNFHRVEDRDERRRLRWVLLGSALGIAPWIVADTLTFYVDFPVGLEVGLSLGAIFATALIPTLTGYAILKHRLFGIRVVIRRGLQYLLARNALRAAVVVPLLLIAMRVVRLRDRPVTEVFLGAPAWPLLLGLAMLGLRFRQPLQLWLDRRFFRDSFTQEQVLLQLIERVQSSSSRVEMARLVAGELEAALHPERVLVYLRGEGGAGLELGHSTGGGAGDPEQLPEALLAALAHDPRPREAAALEQAAGPAARQWLQARGAALVVPLVTEELGLVGALVLGEKRSEEPYAAADRRLLAALAAQTAIACENQLLRERVSRERAIRHDVLAHLEAGDVRLLVECPTCGRCYDELGHCAHDGAELTLTLPIERVLDDRYRLDRRLGQGGMGAVYGAVDLRLNREVAVKVLAGRSLGDAVALRRLRRESRAAASLNHPNIVAVHDFGRAGAEGSFLVMERLPGATLRDELRRRGPVAAPIARLWMEQILAGMGAAHAAGIVHRDLKPENVLLVDDGEPLHLKIADFGLAKLASSEADSPTTLTRAGSVIGTFAYMAPEQLTGGEVDARADVFALGVMLVEMLTGRTPRPAGSLPQLLGSLLHGSYHLEGRGPAVAALDDVLQRCLAADPAERWPDATAFAAALLPLLVAEVRVEPAR